MKEYRRTWDTTDRWHFYRDEAGEWRWKVVARNGKIVVSSSEGYKGIVHCCGNAFRFGCDVSEFPDSVGVTFDMNSSGVRIYATGAR